MLLSITVRLRLIQAAQATCQTQYPHTVQTCLQLVSPDCCLLARRDMIIVLPQNATATLVADTINEALADEAGLQRKAARGLHTGLKHFTCYNKVERILNAVDDFRQGFRGFRFPFGFSLGCNLYHMHDQQGKMLNPWCPGERPVRH